MSCVCLPFLRAILAVIVGLIIGGIINSALEWTGSVLIAPPAGADMITTEGMRASVHLMQLQHFIFPFLADAIASLAGAFVAAKIAGRYHLMAAMNVAILFLAMAIHIYSAMPFPVWFMAIDFLFAYIPMAWIGDRLGRPLARLDPEFE